VHEPKASCDQGAVVAPVLRPARAPTNWP
jgi:hypothetical protein